MHLEQLFQFFLLKFQMWFLFSCIDPDWYPALEWRSGLGGISVIIQFFRKIHWNTQSQKRGGGLSKFNMELVFFKTTIQIGMGRFLWIPAGKQIHFIKRFSSLYLEIKEMIEFIIPLNKQFHLFLINCTTCGLITVSRIAFHICGPQKLLLLWTCGTKK